MADNGGTVAQQLHSWLLRFAECDEQRIAGEECEAARAGDKGSLDICVPDLTMTAVERSARPQSASDVP